MTLLVALANEKQAILVADRRITSGGSLVDDEFNKLCIFFCEDARGAFAYTGIATCGSHSTSDWILEALRGMDEKHEELINILHSLAEKATTDINSLAVLDKRLSILFCGYGYWSSEPEPIAYLISNFELGQPEVGAFRVSRLEAEDGVIVHSAGTSTGFRRRHSEYLKALLKRPLPPGSVLRAAVLKLQESANAHDSHNMIGSQCNSAVILAQRDSCVAATYHSAFHSHRAYGPNIVVNRGMVVFGSEIFATTVLAGPEIRKSDQCWCGSGELFGECHLKKFGSYYVRHPTFHSPMYVVAGMECDVPKRSGSKFWVSSGYQ